MGGEVSGERRLLGLTRPFFFFSSRLLSPLLSDSSFFDLSSSLSHPSNGAIQFSVFVSYHGNIKKSTVQMCEDENVEYTGACKIFGPRYALASFFSSCPNAKGRTCKFLSARIFGWETELTFKIHLEHNYICDLLVMRERRKKSQIELHLSRE